MNFQTFHHIELTSFNLFHIQFLQFNKIFNQYFELVLQHRLFRVSSNKYQTEEVS